MAVSSVLDFEQEIPDSRLTSTPARRESGGEKASQRKNWEGFRFEREREIEMRSPY